MGRGYLLLSKELVTRLLRLPENTELYGAEWDYACDAIRLYVMSPDLKRHPEGAKPPKVSYSVKYESAYGNES
jgi:hypothetical protein